MKQLTKKIILSCFIALTGWQLTNNWPTSTEFEAFNLLEAVSLRRELLHIQWGNVGLCNLYSIDYDPKIHRCGNRAKVYKRPTPLSLD